MQSYYSLPTVDYFHTTAYPKVFYFSSTTTHVFGLEEETRIPGGNPRPERTRGGGGIRTRNPGGARLTRPLCPESYTHMYADTQCTSTLKRLKDEYTPRIRPCISLPLHYSTTAAIICHLNPPRLFCSALVSMVKVSSHVDRESESEDDFTSRACKAHRAFLDPQIKFLFQAASSFRSAGFCSLLICLLLLIEWVQISIDLLLSWLILIYLALLLKQLAVYTPTLRSLRWHRHKGRFSFSLLCLWRRTSVRSEVRTPQIVATAPIKPSIVTLTVE